MNGEEVVVEVSQEKMESCRSPHPMMWERRERRKKERDS